jgi:hypothetical protein
MFYISHSNQIRVCSIHTRLLLVVTSRVLMGQQMYITWPPGMFALGNKREPHHKVALVGVTCEI